MMERQAAYFAAVFHLLKTAAFHEIYMDAAREDLCKDDNYDPRTAFKALDSFRHNRVIAYELYSYFDLHRIESTIEQCEQVIKALNKSISQLDWENFQEMTLPKNIVLKSFALTRFDNVKVEVGTYSKLTYVKQHTEHVIALFLEKQLNFCREFLFQRQEFVRQWGGDIYTMLQKVFKNHKKTKNIQFQEFCQIGRQFGVLFNDNEFYALWKRSKNRRQKVEEMGLPVELQFEQLLVLLLVNDFKTKSRYGMQQNVPIQKSLKRPQPSYKVSHWRKHELWQREQKEAQLNKIRQQCEVKNWTMKYRFSYPHLMDPDWQRKQRASKISQEVDKMSDRELIEAYCKATQKKTIFRQ